MTFTASTIFPTLLGQMTILKSIPLDAAGQFTRIASLSVEFISPFLLRRLMLPASTGEDFVPAEPLAEVSVLPGSRELKHDEIR